MHKQNKHDILEEKGMPIAVGRALDERYLSVQ